MVGDCGAPSASHEACLHAVNVGGDDEGVAVGVHDACNETKEMEGVGDMFDDMRAVDDAIVCIGQAYGAVVGAEDGYLAVGAAVLGGGVAEFNTLYAPSLCLIVG